VINSAEPYIYIYMQAYNAVFFKSYALKWPLLFGIMSIVTKMLHISNLSDKLNK
jgi:hypothetical protein